MTTLWIISYPTADGGRIRASDLVALRDALRVLSEDDSISTPNVFVRIENKRPPICIGASDSDTAVEAASALLEAQGFTTRLNLSDSEAEALRSLEDAPAETDGGEGEVSDYEQSVAQVALVLMQMGDGNPVSALGAAANLANAVGESEMEPGPFFDAGILLAETFNAAAQGGTMQRMAQIGTNGGIGLERDDV